MVAAFLAEATDDRHEHSRDCWRRAAVLGLTSATACRRLPPAVADPQGRGAMSTLGGSGDGSGCVERLMMENATAPTASTVTPAPKSNSGRRRRLALRASCSAAGR